MVLYFLGNYCTLVGINDKDAFSVIAFVRLGFGLSESLSQLDDPQWRILVVVLLQRTDDEFIIFILGMRVRLSAAKKITEPMKQRSGLGSKHSELQFFVSNMPRELCAIKKGVSFKQRVN